jgi:hypothetical protein
VEIAALTAFLAPLLGDLLRGVADRAKDGITDTVWEQTRKLWARLRPKVDGNADAKAAAETLATDPDNGEARATLTFLLRRMLDEDPELKAAVAADWKSISATASGDRSVALVDSDNNIVITGDNVAPPPRT